MCLSNIVWRGLSRGFLFLLGFVLQDWLKSLKRFGSVCKVMQTIHNKVGACSPLSLN